MLQFSGVILLLLGESPAIFNLFKLRLDSDWFQSLHDKLTQSLSNSDWVGETVIWVGLAHPCPCLEPAPLCSDLILIHWISHISLLKCLNKISTTSRTVILDK